MDIKAILDRINENTGLLTAGQLSDIERDILLADLRDLYILVKAHDTVSKTVNNTAFDTETKKITQPAKVELSTDQRETPVQPKIETPVAPAMKEVIPPAEDIHVPPIKAESVITEPIITGVVEETKEDLIPLKEVLNAPPIQEDKSESLLIEKKEDVVNHSNRIHYDEGVPVRGPKVTSLNEVFVGEEKKSINALLGTEKKKALNDHISGKDLNTMIDLNKKHVLTNELFGGNSAAFQTAVSYINTSPTIETAFEYIKTELLPKYKWNGEMQSARLFDKLVRQKFGV